MKSASRILHLLNLILFLGLAGIGVQRYLAGQSPPSQLIVLAVAIVGPLEDILKNLVRQGKPVEEEAAVDVVDRATSAAFLALLLYVLWVLV